MSTPQINLTPDNRSLVEAYQRILDHDPAKWDLYPHLAALLPNGAEQSHIYLQGAWRALEKREYKQALELSAAAERVYGKTFRSRLIDIELLKRQGQSADIPKKFLEITETFKQKNLPAEEVKAYKRLAILDPNPAYYRRIVILYTQINKFQKASKWADKLPKIDPPRPLPPLPIRKESEVLKQPNPISQILPSKSLTCPEIAFGKALWAKYFGDVGEEPPLSSNIDQILDSPCPIWPDKKVRDTHLLVLVPHTVNGKPLNLKTLGELVQKPLIGNSTKYECFSLGKYNDASAPQSHWAFMSRNVIPDSFNKSYQTQQDQIAALRERTNLPYEVPNALDAAICIFTEYVRTGTRLYSDSPWTYTRCQEKWGWIWSLAVGGFSDGGLDVDDSPDVSNRIGVAAMCKFF